MSKYGGLLQSDAFDYPVSTARVALIELTTAQAAAADDDGIATISANTTAKTVTTFDAQPPYARNITVKTSGTEGNVKAGTITVTGLNLNDDEITETITVTADTHVAFTGTKAFLKVTKVEVPAMDGAVTVKVGWGDLYGMPFLFESKPLCIGSVAGTQETVNLTIDDDELEKNTFTFSSAPSAETVKVALIL